MDREDVRNFPTDENRRGKVHKCIAVAVEVSNVRRPLLEVSAQANAGRGIGRHNRSEVRLPSEEWNQRVPVDRDAGLQLCKAIASPGSMRVPGGKHPHLVGLRILQGQGLDHNPSTANMVRWILGCNYCDPHPCTSRRQAASVRPAASLHGMNWSVIGPLFPLSARLRAPVSAGALSSNSRGPAPNKGRRALL